MKFPVGYKNQLLYIIGFVFAFIHLVFLVKRNDTLSCESPIINMPYSI